MLRAVALRFESGAITSTSTPSISRRARRAACRPGAVIPSSLVSRTRISRSDSDGSHTAAEIASQMSRIAARSMHTVRLDIEYDGSGFSGWAAQPGLRTVQGELEAALATVLREPVQLTVAGRTDTGVHALGQVASFVTDAEVPRRSGTAIERARPRRHRGHRGDAWSRMASTRAATPPRAPTATGS